MSHEFEKYYGITHRAETRYYRCCLCGMKAHSIRTISARRLAISDLNGESLRKYWQSNVDKLSCEDFIIMDVIT